MPSYFTLNTFEISFERSDRSIIRTRMTLSKHHILCIYYAKSKNHPVCGNIHRWNPWSLILSD